MKKILTSGLLVLGLAHTAFAAPIKFDFADPKGVNAATFKLDAVLEPIAGDAKGVSGMVTFDPADPAATTGKIVVAAKSVATTNDTMTEHLLSDKWIDATKFPEITFELGKLSNLKTTGGTTTADASGKFTLKGTTRDIVVPVKLTFLPDALEKRTKPGNKGDLLVIRTDFIVTRRDFGIQPGQNEDKVANEINVSLAIVGSAPKS